MTTLQELDALLDRHAQPPVLLVTDEAQGPRTRRGERLEQVFEERVDWVTTYGRPGHLAVDAGDVQLTYAELDARSNQLARQLLANGIKAGDRVALLFDQPVHSYIGLLAVLKINAAYVPLDVAFPADRIAYIIEDSGSKMVLSLSHVKDKVEGLEEFSPQLVYVDRAARAINQQDRSRLTNAERGVPVEDLAYLIYTSGTTGKPKGVAIEHASICNFVRVAGEVYGLRPRDRMYQGLTIAFDFSVEEIWVTWMAGATLVPKPPGQSLLGQDLHAYLSQRHVTALCCVPTLLATIEEDLPHLRFLLVSGEACPQDLITRWHRPGRRFLNVYGPTEATVTATWTVLHPDRPVTIGRPLPTYTAVILDAEDPFRALPFGEVGEIGIAGIGLAVGYLNRDDLTDKAFIPDFIGIAGNPSGRIYRTGDLGRINEDGEIEYLGRIDLQVKIRGYRIELTEIESVLLQMPGVSAAVVNTFEPTPGTTELVGYYSLRSDVSSLDKSAITDFLREQLPSYMVPAYLEQLDKIPLTPQNKADRRALPPPTSGRAGAAQSGPVVAAGSEAERVLAAALAATLGLDEVSVEADFFTELGANSLLLARFATRVRKETSLPAPSIRELYQNPTIRQLAVALGGDAVLAPAGPGGGAQAPRPVIDGTVVRGSQAGYVLTGVAQFVLSIAGVLLGAYIMTLALTWIAEPVLIIDKVWRSVALTWALFALACVLPILLKWLVIGRMRPGRFRLWGLRHFRYGFAVAAMKASPLRLFSGTPLYNLYLRMLGAKVGKGAVIFSTTVPDAPDLVSIGAGTVVRRGASFTGARAREGHIELGPVTIGRDAVVGDASVLDLDTRMGDGAQLGHASALLSGQVVPNGERWHGSPAEPTGTDFRIVEPLRRNGLRTFLYCTLLSLLPMLFLPTAALGILALLGWVPPLAALLGPGSTGLLTWQLHVVALAIAALFFVVGIPIALLVVLTVPRLLNLFVKPDKAHPLFGIQFLLCQMISGLTNTFFTRLLGDSSFVTGYLDLLGYKLRPIQETGSNFGLIFSHDSPYLTAVGTGSMISDGLQVANLEYTSTSFRASEARIGRQSFFGNRVLYPADATVGDNCLIATKAMVPIDGPRRHDTGLLGSPAFEIPRSVERDERFDGLMAPDVLPGRLAAKNRSNLLSITLYLLALYFFTYLGLITIAAAIDLFSLLGAPGVAAAGMAGGLLVYAFAILFERATTGFRAQQPQFCSIYEKYFWRHERFWKFSTTPIYDIFNGTPFKGLVLRLLGVKVGRRVYDGGCSIPERTLVTIGDDTILNAGSSLWGHTLEDGTFKSDRLTVGSGVTLGVGSFVLYGTVLGDGAVLEADAFLLKGEEMAPFTRWEGNPATEARTARPAVSVAPAPAAPQPVPPPVQQGPVRSMPLPVVPPRPTGPRGPAPQSRPLPQQPGRQAAMPGVPPRGPAGPRQVPPPRTGQGRPVPQAPQGPMPPRQPVPQRGRPPRPQTGPQARPAQPRPMRPGQDRRLGQNRPAAARTGEPIVTRRYVLPTTPPPPGLRTPLRQATLSPQEIAMSIEPTLHMPPVRPVPSPGPRPGTDAEATRPAGVRPGGPAPAGPGGPGGPLRPAGGPVGPGDRPGPGPARPSVTTALPGPRSAELLKRQEQRESNARVYPRHFPFAVADATGSHIRDLDGNVFLDFLAGAGVLALGHNHPELVAAAAAQMNVFTHGLDMPSPVKDAFTTAQLSMLPVGMRDRMKIHFCGPTGANAVDAAIKLAKTATGRGDVIAFRGGFHGTTHAAMALTGNLSTRSSVANTMPGVHFFSYPTGGVPAGVDPATWDTTCAALLEQALRDPNGGIPLPAAVIMEMVQGEGGVNPATQAFAQRVRKLTRDLGIPLIVDEVQTGCGRTGTWFAFEQYDIEPDIVVASKGLSGMGLPVAIILYQQDLDKWVPGAHTGTFRGNQLAFAAGTKFIEILRRDGVLDNVKARGEQIAGRLAGATAHPAVREVRGRGLMWGVELNPPTDGRTVTDLALDVQARALRAGLILELGGRDDAVVRMLPPLNVTAESVDFAVTVLLKSINDAHHKTPAT